MNNKNQNKKRGKSKEREQITAISDSRFSNPNQQAIASVEEIFNTYYDYLKSYQPRSHMTVKKSKKYHQFFFGLKKITPKDIVAYRQQRLSENTEDAQKRKKTKAAVSRELQHCHSAYTRAINAGLTDRNPFE